MPKSGIILLSYDGYKSNNDKWGNIYWIPSRMSRIERDSVNSQVREFYRLWDVTVTENENIFYAYPKDKRVRCVVTLTPLYEVGQIGISYPFGLRDGDTTCALVNPSVALFDNYTIAVSIAHEVGHQVGLLHHVKVSADGTTVIVDTGNSVKSPIMGWGLLKNRVWEVGMTYNNGFALQNDTTIISSVWQRIK